MLNYQITPTEDLNGDVKVPGDKSISHRAVILSAIAEGHSELHGFLMGTDNLATLSALQQMGVPINYIEDENIVMVDGVGLHGLQAPPDVLDLGNSGTGIRLLTGLLAGQSFDCQLTGDQSLQQRPMKRIVDPLALMGASITTAANGTPPLTITGQQSLSAIHYTLPVASAQIKSCLLLAGLYAKGETIITAPAPVRDHTERLLRDFHYPVKGVNNSVYLKGGDKLSANNVMIVGDMSSAAFFIVAATIAPGSLLRLCRVGVNPTRTGIIHLLRMMGAHIDIENIEQQNGEPVADIVVHFANLHGITVPEDQVSLAIDEFPILLIAAACADGKTTVRGADELRVKETDRIAMMAAGLQQLGINVDVLTDGIVVEGGQLQGGTVDSGGDHRIAMAFAIAGCIAEGAVTVNNCDNVQTSFPNFIELANSVGMDIDDDR